MINERSGAGPLSGIRVLEIGGIGPAPFAGMLLGDLGADVVRLDPPAQAGAPSPDPVLFRNRRSVTVDLKQRDGVEVVTHLARGVDAVIEGFRPGVLERLGLGPEQLLAANPNLVIGRVTGWGQDGPLASAPGHDINFVALSGALHGIGPKADPVVPLNLVGDMGGGGMLLAFGVIAGILNVRTGGQGQVVDASMVDGAATLLSMVYGFLAKGRWADGRQANSIDGSAPWYGVYRCNDDKHVAVGAGEPKFYKEFIQALGLSDDPDFANQHDRSAWPRMRSRLAGVFAQQSRDNWEAKFAETQACVTPILSVAEAPQHPHNLARGTFQTGTHGGYEPAPVPRYSASPPAAPRPAPRVGAHTDEVLAEIGLPPPRILTLRNEGIVR